jgi:hypothetical protein
MTNTLPKTSTKRQIVAAMKKAGIVGVVTGAGRNWEVELPNEETATKFMKTICSVGGYQTGYGAWVLRPNYESLGDWNDKSSRWHY